MSAGRSEGGGAPPVEGAAAACGRLGLGAAEIAEGVGWTRGEFEAVAARWSELAATRSRAQEATLAWWEGRLRRSSGTARPGAGVWVRAMAERFGKAAAPEPARPRRELTARDRAKAVRLLLAQAGEAGDGRSGEAQPAYQRAFADPLAVNTAKRPND